MEKNDSENKVNEELKEHARQYFQGIWVNSEKYAALCDFINFIDASDNFEIKPEISQAPKTKSTVPRYVDIVYERIEDKKHKFPEYDVASNFLFNNFSKGMGLDPEETRAFLNDLTRYIREHPNG